MSAGRRGQALGNLAAIDAALAARGLDAIIAVSPENVRYTSDVSIPTQTLLRHRLAFVVWPRAGGHFMLVATNEAAYVREATWIDDVRTYVEHVDDPVAVLCGLLRERGLGAGRIALEDDYLSARSWLRLSQELPQLETEPAQPIFDRARMHKTPHEKALIVEAFQATERALKDVFMSAREGDTEHALALRLVNGMLEGGADQAGFVYLTAGPNSGYAHKLPGAYAIRRGDFVKADVGSVTRLYRTNLGRTAVAGEPSDAQAGMWRDLCRIHAAIGGECRAGRLGRDVYKKAQELFAEAGLPAEYPHFGHGIGLGLHERPAIRPTEDIPFEPGMLVTVETRHREAGKLGMHMEDLIEITDGAPVWHTGPCDGKMLYRIRPS